MVFSPHKYGQVRFKRGKFSHLCKSATLPRTKNLNNAAQNTRISRAGVGNTRLFPTATKTIWAYHDVSEFAVTAITAMGEHKA